MNKQKEITEKGPNRPWNVIARAKPEAISTGLLHFVRNDVFDVRLPRFLRSLAMTRREVFQQPQKSGLTRESYQKVNPLSLLLFYYRNFGKFLPFSLIVLFSVLAIIVSAALFSSSYDTHKFYSNCYRTTARVYFPADTPSPTEIFKEYPSISEIYAVNLRRTTPVKILGIFPMFYPGIGVKNADLEGLMRYLQVKLRKGRLFKEGTKEVILSEETVRSRKQKLGGLFFEADIERMKEGIKKTNPKVRTIWIKSLNERTYKIVGLLEGKSAVVFLPYKEETIRRKFPKDKEYKDYKQQLMTFSGSVKYDYKAHKKLLNKAQNKYRKKFKERLEYSTWRAEDEKQVEDFIKRIGFISGIFLVLAVITFSVVTISLTLLYSEERFPEYGLLLSFGLTKFQIMKRNFCENFGIILLGWLFGVGLAKICLEIIKRIIFVPRGWFLQTFPVDVLPYTVPIPLGMLLCAVVVSIYKLWKVDPVGSIERKW